MSLVRKLHEWHDFYVVIGGASGILLGAMFVGRLDRHGRSLTADNAHRTRAFVTPTVVNVSFVLIACAVLLTPVLNWQWLAALAGAASLVGLIYAAVIGRQIWRVKSIRAIGSGMVSCRRRPA